MIKVSTRFFKSSATRRFRPTQERCALDPTRQDAKALHIVAQFADLLRACGTLPSRFNLPRVVAAIGADQFGLGEAPAYLVQDLPSSVAVLDRGGVDDTPYREPSSADQGVDFPGLHLRAGA